MSTNHCNYAVLREFQRTVRFLSNGEMTFYDNAKLLETVGQHLSLQFPAEQQNDVHEFLTKLLEQLEMELADTVHKGLVKEHFGATTAELAALDPSLRPVADRLALTSAAVWSLSTLDSLQQQDLAYRFAEPGLLDDIVDLDDFIARAFAREKTYEILLRESVSFMEPDLVNVIQGLPFDLSRSCLRRPSLQIAAAPASGFSIVSLTR